MQDLRILIVDDDEIDRMAVIRALRKFVAPIEIREAQTCAEAIDYLQSESFDCVFLDYRLPDNDGLYLLAAIRHKLDGNAPPSIVLTGQGDERIAVELMKAGATDYLSKSRISAEILAGVLRNALRIARAEREVRATNERLRQNNELLLQQNRDLEAQRDRIDRQNLQRDDFIAHLTHDLRTPLVAAKMMFDLFEKEAFGALSPEMHQALDSMAQSNQYLLNMVNTLLEVNRYESGHKVLNPSKCDLRKIARDAIDELQSQAQSKSLELSIDNKAPVERALVVMGDCQELRRMLVNTIGHAIKVTDRGSVTVRLDFQPANDREQFAPNGWVAIEVCDTGVGMSAAERATLFDRFQVGKQRQAGSSLGLYLARRIIDMHFGSIDLTSELGRGTTFAIYLPACCGE